MTKPELEQRLISISDNSVMFGRIMAYVDAHLHFCQSSNLARIAELEALVKQKSDHIKQSYDAWVKENSLRLQSDKRIAELDFENKRLNNILDEWSKDYTGK